MPSMNEQEFIGYVKAREADVGSVFNELDVNGDGCLRDLCVCVRGRSAIFTDIPWQCSL